ncbi:sigma-70 family RNA polymerase sigma factor [Micromonospora sp. NPDC003197]
MDRVAAALGLLTAEDIRGLIAEFAVDSAPEPSIAATTEHLFTAPGVEQEPRPVDRRRLPRSAEGFLPPRPPTGPLSRGPHSHRSRPGRRPVRVALLAIGMAIIIGAGSLFVLTDSTRHPSPSPVVAFASAEDIIYGIHLTAVIYGGEGGATVRLTTGGLGVHTPCQLFAVTTDGAELVLGQLTCGDDGGQYVGPVTIPVDQLRSFIIRQLDGTVMVEADVMYGSPSASTTASSRTSSLGKGPLTFRSEELRPLVNFAAEASIIVPMDPTMGYTAPEELTPASTEERALRLAYQQHGPVLLNYLLRLTNGNRGMAEDIVQETLVRAWSHPEARTNDGQWSRAWLFTVARRIAIDHIRAAQRRPAEVLDERIEDHRGQDDDIERLLNAQAVREAVAGLPERLRSALIEIYFQEHSAAEAAENLAVPVGTVKSRTFYALRALHKALIERGFTF